MQQLKSLRFQDITMHASLIWGSQNYSETVTIVGQVNNFKTFKHSTTEMLWRRALCCCSTQLRHAEPQHIFLPPPLAAGSHSWHLPSSVSDSSVQHAACQLGNIAHLVGSL